MQPGMKKTLSPAKKAATTLHRDGPPAPPWPSFPGTAQFVGTSPSGAVNVFVDASLGAPAVQNAQDLVADADRVVDANNALFGTPGGPVDIIVFALGGATDGTGGADHLGCDYTTGAAIEVCASFGNSARVSALFEAELSECSMGGNLCGVSTGEALSRWCAAVIGNNALSDFASAPTWVQNGMPNFVDKTAPTDQDAVSTGCGMAFLSWMQSLGHTLSEICPAMVALTEGGTFAQLYGQLTNDSAANAFPTFLAAVRALPNGVNDDDPFAAAATAGPEMHLDPHAIAMAGTLFSAILYGMTSGKTPDQIAATVKSHLVAGMSKKATGGTCKTGSRRLRAPR